MKMPCLASKNRNNFFGLNVIFHISLNHLGKVLEMHITLNKKILLHEAAFVATLSLASV